MKASAIADVTSAVGRFRLTTRCAGGVCRSGPARPEVRATWPQVLHCVDTVPHGTVIGSGVADAAQMRESRQSGRAAGHFHALRLAEPRWEKISSRDFVPATASMTSAASCPRDKPMLTVAQLIPAGLRGPGGAAPAGSRREDDGFPGWWSAAQKAPPFRFRGSRSALRARHSRRLTGKNLNAGLHDLHTADRSPARAQQKSTSTAGMRIGYKAALRLRLMFRQAVFATSRRPRARTSTMASRSWAATRSRRRSQSRPRTPLDPAISLARRYRSEGSSSGGHQQTWKATFGRHPADDEARPAGE